MKVKAIRTNCRTGVEREVEIEIIRRKYPGLDGWWYSIVKGGVTGFESCRCEFFDRDMRWWACIGAKDRWDKLFVPPESLLRIKMMNYSLVTESEEFTEKKGMINIYACGCGRVVVYGYEDNGVTPNIIICDQCGGEAFSQFEQVTQPSRIWYRPSSLEELEKIAEAAWAAGADTIYCNEDKAKMIGSIFSNYVEHYNNGGLFARMV